MRRTRLLAVLPLVAVLAACGGGGTPRSGGTPTGTGTGSASPSPSVPPTAEIDAMLLTAADLGEGWTAGAPEDSSDDDPSASPTASPTSTGESCSMDAQDFGEAGRLTGRSVELENEQTASFVTHEVEIYGPGAAAGSLGEARAFFQRCMELVEEEEGQSFTLKVTDWTGLATYGDETLAKRLQASTQGIELTGGFIAFRKGDRLSVLFGMSVSAKVEDFLPAAATKAAAKLA